jgi:NAD(P)-dependent dehydrogenase (short-subunit alcohol dehydrogenase family)
LINAAGVAHIEHPTPADLERLRVGNVELPMALAAAALEHGVSMIHISSVKATGQAGGPYASSKREAERRLEGECAERFAEAGLRLIIVRPLALLFPPFDAGKVRRLKMLRYWPRQLTPTLRLPVVTPATFLEAVEATVAVASSNSGPSGLMRREFGHGERGTFRDLRAAMVHSPAASSS